MRFDVSRQLIGETDGEKPTVNLLRATHRIVIE
jgi:hypothetical protein